MRCYRVRWLHVGGLSAILLILLACNLSLRSADRPADPSTEPPASAAPTSTPTAIPTSTPTPTPTATATPTLTPSPTLVGGGQGQLAFVAGERTPTGEHVPRDIFVLDLTSLALVIVTAEISLDIWSVAWSPDGTRLAFEGRENTSSRYGDIYIVNADGSGLTNLTNTPSLSEYSPLWLPEDNEIGFARSDEVASYRYSLAVGAVEPVLWEGVFCPRGLSHDGAWCIFGEGSGPVVIYGMQASNASQEYEITRLRQGRYRPIEADWSPDNRQVAFSMFTEDDHFNIFVVNRDGTGLTNVTPTLYWASTPCWSPDGSLIAFDGWMTSLSDAHTLFAINSDGSHVQPLLDLDGVAQGFDDCDWRP